VSLTACEAVNHGKVASIMPCRKGKSQTLLGAVPHAHNDHERPLNACPTCGRRYDEARIEAPFDPGTSALLDLVVIAKDALTEVQVALEQEVLS
jgi:hypothetical protein